MNRLVDVLWNRKHLDRSPAVERAFGRSNLPRRAQNDTISTVSNDRRTVPRTFGALLWESYRGTYSPITTAIGLAIAFAAWRYPVSPNVSLFTVFLALALSLPVFAALANAAFVAHRAAQKHLPRVRAGAAAPAGYGDVAAICMLDPSELFSHGSLVAFYFTDDSGFERLFGIGSVLNIQRDDLIQVALSRMLPGYDDILARIKSNDVAALARVTVKPNVPDVMSFS